MAREACQLLLSVGQSPLKVSGILTTSRRVTPEVTVLDLVASRHHGAGLSNVATVVREFIETNAIDVESLSRTANQYPITVRQRVGWPLSFMSEQLGQAIDLVSLLETVQGGREHCTFAV